MRDTVRYVRAMRADHLPVPSSAGLWYVKRNDLAAIPIDARVWRIYGFHGPEALPLSSTALMRWTLATLHQPDGECVMSDDPQELRRHLPAVLAARGRVLVTGLGLGCVVRGLLANPRVEHVDVVEVDRHVLDLVGGSFAGEPRVSLHHGDARTYAWPAETRWDLAWHDVWDEHQNLAIVHGRLLARYQTRARRQGAWQFPRWAKRIWPRPLVNASRKQGVAL